ncbi:MAG: hypothetical protein N2690_07805, partial [Rhodocyclaceae bacterium]|nr:hypothetical protein [Rhodocyclaceae bacterium]
MNSKQFQRESDMLMKLFQSKRDEKQAAVKYPGIRDAVDGNTAVIHVEREASDAAGAYPITPSTQMGEYWAEEVARGCPTALVAASHDATLGEQAVAAFHGGTLRVYT